MNKNLIIGILGIAVVILAIMLAMGPGPGPKLPTPEGITNAPPVTAGAGIAVTNAPGCANREEPEAPVTSVTNEKSPVTEEDIKRLADVPQRVTAVVDIKGAGQYSKLCYKSSGNFHYVHSLVAKSFVKKHDPYPNGMVEIEEERSFEKAREMIDLENTDVALSFERIPLEDIRQWAETVCAAADTVAGYAFQAENLLLAAAGTGVSLGAEAVKLGAETLQKLDGTSVRDFFVRRGLKMPAWLDRMMNNVAEKEAMKRLEAVRGHVQRLEGSEYILSYYQSKSGAPMSVTYRRKDGGALSLEEREVLDAVNVFLDSKVLPDREKKEWTVSAKDIEQIVGAATGGRIEGELSLKRIADNPKNGNWQIKVVPKPLDVLNEKGIPSGAVAVQFGGGEFDPNGQILRSFQFVGKGKLNVETMRRFLFFKCVTRSIGDCEFRSSLATEPLEK